MDDCRIPKAVLYSELSAGKRNRGGQHLRYKDVLKRHLNACSIPAHKWEAFASMRPEWRYRVKTSVKKFEETRLINLDAKRQERKTRPKPSYVYTYNSSGQLYCASCDRTFKNITMDLNLMDKLRLLKIDTDLRPQIKMKPMSRFYFITSTNPGEQFFVFVSTAAWLIRKAGNNFEQPNEEDDPNSAIANIMEVLREKQITVDFSSHKLKQGFGEEVCYILNILADEAMKKENFVWHKPIVDLTDTKETIDDADQVEDETEITLDKVEEEMAIYSEESEGEFGSEDDKESSNVADKVHDWEAWKLELERVAPALRLKITADGRDWRARHAQMKSYRDELFDRFKTTGTQLNKLHGNISSVMDKITARENILNEQFEPLVKEYGSLLDELSKVTNEYKEVSVGVTERQEMLNELTAKVENIKQRTESKGSSMNDNSPLVTAKKAVAALKKDIQELDFQIIVLLWLLTTKENPNSNNLLGNVESRMATNEVY